MERSRLEFLDHVMTFGEQQYNFVSPHQTVRCGNCVGMGEMGASSEANMQFALTATYETRGYL